MRSERMNEDGDCEFRRRDREAQIRRGCVRTGERLGASLAPAFHGRGFDAQIGPPLGRTWDDVPVEVQAACAAACPTGAMAFSADRK